MIFTCSGRANKNTHLWSEQCYFFSILHFEQPADYYMHGTIPSVCVRHVKKDVWYVAEGFNLQWYSLLKKTSYWELELKKKICSLSTLTDFKTQCSQWLCF